MPRLQDQLDEVALLESMFSAPGEFQIEDRISHEQAEAYVNHLTPDPPKCLSFRLCVPINAHHYSDDEGSSDDEGASCANAESEPLVSHSVRISVRLPSRYVSFQ